MKRNWGIGIAVAGGAYLFNSVMQADRDDSGAIVGEGSARRLSDASRRLLRRRLGVRRRNEVDSVPGVPCSKPHDNEVYAVFDVTAASFPGDAMADMANEGCLERFEPFVGRTTNRHRWTSRRCTPRVKAGSGQNDREVVCAVYDIDAKKLTGSVKGLAL